MIRNVTRLTVLLAVACFFLDARAATVRHVVHISLDGLGAIYLQFYVTNAPAEFPTFNRLMAEGAYTMNARCDFDISETVPNHASMFTGRPVFKPAGAEDFVHHGYNNNFPGPGETFHNAGNTNVPYKASMFDVVHDYGLSTALYTGKTRLGICDRSYDDANGALDLIDEDNGRDKIDFSIVADISGAAISNQVNNILQDLNSETPRRYRFIHIAEPDLTGHSSGWGSVNWSNAVRNVDRQLGRILDAINANPVLSNETALIVTADHGGGGVIPNAHTESYHIANYTIPFFFWGPGVPGGTDLYTLFGNRGNPGTNRTDYTTDPQPIRGGDGSNLALALLGLPPIPGSLMTPVLGGAEMLLSMARFEGRLGVFWSDPTDSYVLEATDEFGQASRWQVITNDIEVSDSTKVFTVTNAAAASARYFRLRKRVLSIVSHPQSQSAFIGDTVTLQATVQASAPVTYQWRLNGATLGTATNTTLLLADVQPSAAGDYVIVVSDALGSVTSAVATLTVLLDPVITQPPQSLTVRAGTNVNFTVSALGSGALAYQWRHNGTNLPGAVDATLSIADVQVPDEGSYDVVVTDAYGSAISAPAELAVRVPITIVERPLSQAVAVGETVTFTARIEGHPPPFLYTWRKDNVIRWTEFSNERFASITISNAQLSDAGSYRVIVSNIVSAGATIAPATLTVTNSAFSSLSR